MATIGELLEALKQEVTQDRAFAEAAKSALVKIGQVVNEAIRSLNGASPPPAAASSSEGGKSKGGRPMKAHGVPYGLPKNKVRHGRHIIWHGRLSGQFDRQDGSKACSNCHKIKPMTTDYFSRSSGTPTGYQSWCKLCNATRMAAANRRAPDIHPVKAGKLLRRHSVDPAGRSREAL